MGRAKLKMELIPKEKARINAFKKRKQGLVRKMHEFTTLCDVSACMIIYGPKQDSGSSSEPELWPEDPAEVRRVVDIFRAKNKDPNYRPYGLVEFLEERKRKSEEELVKQRRKNLEAKYPTWLDFMNFLPEFDLRDFAASLRSKADLVKSRIEFLVETKRAELMAAANTGLVNNCYNSNMHVPNYYPGGFVDQNQNAMAMMLMGNGNQFGYGGPDFGWGPLFPDMGWYDYEPKPLSWQCYGGGPGPGPSPVLPYLEMGQQVKVEETKNEGDQEELFQMPYNNNNNVVGSCYQ